ncbi:hypothetical protein [Streptomyces poriferorum]|uniref:Uncharacterized protein n=1 Tax=Streptomyces poriferorum TaxID=2798799 RepID=A0ABY9J3A5_9ACTN|nr:MULTISPECIES: hypothetical protein [unclassified Streptomyces]MDP5310440.1 hypothetical protein [Streptomyces sp. Alt4]WLQ60406.1 hypothetical protein P8A19_35505 [Streptomyces sp. Alt2]
MIRETRFLISRKPFAIALETVTGEQHPRGDRYAFSGSATAVWYRRKAGVTRACIGELMLFNHYLPRPLDLNDPHDILAANLDGRYGGTCHGRWDGERYWGSEKPESMAVHLAVLRPMLADYPVIPAGFDGWWTYQAAEGVAA